MTPILILHIAGGSIGLLTGAVALTVRKGERLHRTFGTVFLVAMLIMSAMASYLAVTVPGQIGNLSGGMFTFYLILTAWMTVRRKEGTIGRFEVGALAASSLAAAFGIFIAAAIALSPAIKLSGGVPRIAVYVFAAITVLAAATDLKVVLKRGISGAPRIARHIWRMCLGLFVATGSFFIGKQDDMPAFMRGSPILLVLAFAPFGFMVFWLFRVRLTNWWRQSEASPAASAG